MTSPYHGTDKKCWAAVTRSLARNHPINQDEIVTVVLKCWDSIFESQIGRLRIGVDLFPAPQVMGSFLHELIPDEFQRRHPKRWRTAQGKNDKDMVYVHDHRYSIEIKTSSNASQIFRNRSYAQPDTIGAKPKTGYYITVNFQKFKRGQNAARPKVTQIRFGWLDHTDWIGQQAPTGQKAKLSPETYKLKFLTLYDQKRSSK